MYKNQLEQAYGKWPIDPEKLKLLDAEIKDQQKLVNKIKPLVRKAEAELASKNFDQAAATYQKVQSMGTSVRANKQREAAAARRLLVLMVLLCMVGIICGIELLACMYTYGLHMNHKEPEIKEFIYFNFSDIFGSLFV